MQVRFQLLKKDPANDINVFYSVNHKKTKLNFDSVTEFTVDLSEFTNTTKVNIIIEKDEQNESHVLIDKIWLDDEDWTYHKDWFGIYKNNDAGSYMRTYGYMGNNGEYIFKIRYPFVSFKNDLTMLRHYVGYKNRLDVVNVNATPEEILS
jgi:hypothetical protein